MLTLTLRWTLTNSYVILCPVSGSAIQSASCVRSLAHPRVVEASTLPGSVVHVRMARTAAVDTSGNRWRYVPSLLPSCSFVSVAQRLAHRPVAALTARMAVNKRLPLSGTSCIRRHRDAVVSPCLLSGDLPACVIPAAKSNPLRRTVLPSELSRLLSLVL